ncbi:Hypothetical protein CINCED_3A013277 [Cinara cedri]|uniref:FY-rich, C-terminal n=1 Tax=Cinara cedri TaxID=506608 RepID=A0A5E4NQM5_9HEMI|nr:Hypothetical protein CINCED_3A013277 [Cinara cedri]
MFKKFTEKTIIINDMVNVNQIKVNKSYPKKKGNINGVNKPKCPYSNHKNYISETPKPVTIGEVTIFNFGQIVYDTPFYYSDCAIYSVGYYATRTYAHFRNIYSKCTYHCKVMKSGSSPRFEIMDHDKHFKVTGLSTDECHNHLLSLINKMLGNDDLMFATNNGDRFFGLSLPLVRHKLQENPESKFCTGYIPQLQVDIEEEIVAENDPSVSFEGLHSWLKNYQTFY